MIHLVIRTEGGNNMTIKLIKTGASSWVVKKGFEAIGDCKPSHKYGGSYEATMTDGATIYGVSQKALISIIKNKYGQEVK